MYGLWDVVVRLIGGLQEEQIVQSDVSKDSEMKDSEKHSIRRGIDMK